MKTRKILCSFAVAGLALVIGAPSVALAAQPSSFQVSNVVDFETGVAVNGAGKMTRTKKAVWVDINTQDLRANTVYTMWWIVWNNPSQCVDGCGEDDLGVRGNSIFYAGGFISDANGAANVSIHVEAGNLRGGIQVLLGSGLNPNKGNKAEMHVLIRSHGAPVAGSVDYQISSVEGLCDVNECTDDLGIVFEPL